MPKGRQTGHGSRTRSGPVVVTRPRKDLIALLPQEVVNLIIDNLKHNYRPLISCSLVCRAFASRTREILFRRIFLSFGGSCNRHLRLPRTTLACVKSLQMIHGILGGTRIMNQPSFPQLMARLGPLRLTLGHLSWSDLNDEARRALSIHDFRNIKFEWSAFPSIVDLGDLLSGSAELETLILGRLEIEDASIPLHPRHQRGPSVERLRLHALNAESSIFTTIVDSRVSPVSFDKLRALDVTISNAEELIALQNVLKTSNTLETLTVSHIHYNSHSRPLPRPRLNLKNLLHLNLELHDFHNHMYPIVHTDLFEWWCTVWTKAKVISMKELSIKTSFKSDWNEDYDVTVWAKIAVALSRPVWVLLPKLFITIDASNQEIGQELYRYKDAVQRAMDGSSVDVWIEVDYPQDYYEPDEAMYPGSEEEQEEEDVGYSDLDDW